MVYSDNRYLTREEMSVNAQHILDVLVSKGWTKNAVAGMLGNMETESTINPGIWQSLRQGNMSGGFGLVQWTPATNYTNWADSRGYSWGDIDGQLERLQFEIDNGLQWIKTTAYPLSFQEFKESTRSPEWLGQAFLRNYERPRNQNQPDRSTQARYWFDNLDGEGVGGSKPFFPTTEGLEITSKWGWRDHPETGEYTFHAAIDIGGGGSSHPIYATQSGEIIANSFNSISGNFIRIKHSGDDYYSQYLHMESPSPLRVGTKVNKGQQIGIMGNTGSSTGIHLDFAIAIRPNGWFTEDGTIDPELYLEMEFDDGWETPVSDLNKNILTLLMVDALNGWKW